jgi:tRNA(adenine34) deaminase
MGEALILAKNAEKHDDVPVGAVIVKNGEIIAKGQNRREEHKNSLAHAEIEAINNACSVLGSKYLTGCTLYVTLEPCPMCTGAIINSRIDRVVFGAYDDKAGCMGTMTDMTALSFNHKP